MRLDGEEGLVETDSEGHGGPCIFVNKHFSVQRYYTPLWKSYSYNGRRSQTSIVVSRASISIHSMPLQETDMQEKHGVNEPLSVLQFNNIQTTLLPSFL